MATNVTANGVSKKFIITWSLTILIPLVVLLIPVNEIFTWKLKLYMAITLAGILIMAFESLNQAGPSHPAASGLHCFPISAGQCGLFQLAELYSLDDGRRSAAG